jgi:hypothetical protein
MRHTGRDLASAERLKGKKTSAGARCVVLLFSRLFEAAH